MDLERIRGIVERVAGSEGLELVAVEWAGPAHHGVLRIIIDRLDRSIGHQDCQTVSEQVGARLDVEDLIPGRYVLEVASPGLDRKLCKPADYERFRGRQVKVRLRLPHPELGGKRFEARLEGLADGVVTFQVGDRQVQVPYEQIGTVNLLIEL